jgi:signal transduction histidine kinase
MVTRPDQLPRRGELVVGGPHGSPTGQSGGLPYPGESGEPAWPPGSFGAPPPHGTGQRLPDPRPAEAPPPGLTNAEPGAPPAGDARPKRPRRRLLSDAKIRTKVIVVILLPVLVIISLAAVAVASSVQSASQAASVERLARFGTVMSGVVDALQHERDAAAIYLSANTPASRTKYNQATSTTDIALGRLRDAQAALGGIPPAVSIGLQQLGEQLSQLADTRTDVRGGKLAVAENQLRYTNVVERLLTLGEEVASGSQNGELVLRVRALAAFSRVKEAAAQELSLVDGFLRDKKFGAGQYRSYYSALSNQYGGYQQFIALATRPQRETAATMLSGSQLAQASRLESAIARGDPTVLTIDSRDWSSAMNTKLDRMKQVESALSNGVLDLAVSSSNRAVRQAVIDSALVLLALLLALGVSILMARNIVRPVSRLRREALATAYERLPDAVARLRSSDAVASRTSEADLAETLRSRAERPNNELGQLGSAFDAMHDEAVRIALEQAALRSQVGSMVVNLSRRSRAMVNRLLTQLDRMEAGEEDSDRLDELFRLDHLATRMRRNDESLLVLAGARAARQRGEPASLLDVVRAAQSEVEQYARIDTDEVDPGVYVNGAGTDDLAHLLAELMENATQFSQPATRVTVRTRRLHDGVLLEIDDQGIGIVAEELADFNRRLHEAASVEVASDRRLGLFVVGKLAARFGVDVSLLRLPDGTRVRVRLPNSLLLAADQVPVEDVGHNAPHGPTDAAPIQAQPLLDRPLRPSRMQYWAAGEGTPGPAPMALPQYGGTAHTDVDGDGLDALPRRNRGALLFPGNVRPEDRYDPYEQAEEQQPYGQPPYAPPHSGDQRNGGGAAPGYDQPGFNWAAAPPVSQVAAASRPHEVRQALSSLRRGVEQGRSMESRIVDGEEPYGPGEGVRR